MECLGQVSRFFSEEFQGEAQEQHQWSSFLQSERDSSFLRAPGISGARGGGLGRVGDGAVAWLSRPDSLSLLTQREEVGLSELRLEPSLRRGPGEGRTGRWAAIAGSLSSTESVFLGRLSQELLI